MWVRDSGLGYPGSLPPTCFVVRSFVESINLAFSCPIIFCWSMILSSSVGLLWSFCWFSLDRRRRPGRQSTAPPYIALSGNFLSNSAVDSPERCHKALGLGLSLQLVLSQCLCSRQRGCGGVVPGLWATLLDFWWLLAFGLVWLASVDMCIVVVYSPRGMLFRNQALHSIPLFLLNFWSGYGKSGGTGHE